MPGSAKETRIAAIGFLTGRMPILVHSQKYHIFRVTIYHTNLYF